MKHVSAWSRPRRLTALLVGSAAVAALACAGSASAGAPGAYESITSAGPLTAVVVGRDLRCQVDRNGIGQIYKPYERRASCQTFVAEEGSVITDGGAYVADPLAQSDVTGAGTQAFPYRLETTVALKTDAFFNEDRRNDLIVTQVDSYVVGDEFWTTTMTVRNNSTRTRELRLYRYWDCYLGNDDRGYGFINEVVPGSVGCSLTPNNSPSDLIEAHIPVSAPGQSANRYWMGYYSDASYFAYRGQDLPNECECEEFIDNGATIQWNLEIPPGGSATRAVREVFSPVGDIPNPDALPDATTEFGITPGSHDFGGESAGSTTPAETFTVENVGATAMTINAGGITLGGANPGQFKVIGGTCAAGRVVAAGASCTIAAVFAPTGSASVEAKLQVATTDGTRSSLISGRAPNRYDALVEAEKDGTALERIVPVKRVVAKGTRTVRATVTSGFAAQGAVALNRCLNSACTRYVKVRSKSVNFTVGSQTVSLTSKGLRPGRYQWIAAMGPSEVTSYMLVRGARVAPPVTG